MDFIVNIFKEVKLVHSFIREIPLIELVNGTDFCTIENNWVLPDDPGMQDNRNFLHIALCMGEKLCA